MAELLCAVVRAVFWVCVALTACLADMFTELWSNRSNGAHPITYEETPEQVIARYEWAVQQLEADHEQEMQEIMGAVTPRWRP